MYKFVELWTCHDWNRIFNNFANHDHLFQEMLLDIAILTSEKCKICIRSFRVNILLKSLGINGHFRPIGLTSYCIIFPLGPTGGRQQKSFTRAQQSGNISSLSLFCNQFCVLLNSANLLCCIASSKAKSNFRNAFIIWTLRRIIKLGDGSWLQWKSPGSIIEVMEVYSLFSRAF